jgi:hypothetical protein
MEGPVLMMAKGVNGTLELLPDRIRIRRQGWTAPLYDRHERSELLFKQIAAIEYKETMGGMGGYLAFHDDAGREIFEDYCVSFLKPQQPAFSAFKKAMEPLWKAVQLSIEDTKLQLTHVEAPV